MGEMQPEAREGFISGLKGRTITEIYYEDQDTKSGPYWVVTLDNGAEFCFRTMAELVNG